MYLVMISFVVREYLLSRSLRSFFHSFLSCVVIKYVCGSSVWLLEQHNEVFHHLVLVKGTIALGAKENNTSRYRSVWRSIHIVLGLGLGLLLHYRISITS